jgi:hypothetical protein
MDGLRAGSGVLAMRDGSRYIGDFHNGSADGYGVNIRHFSIKFASTANVMFYFVAVRLRRTPMARSTPDSSKLLLGMSSWAPA